MADNVELKLEQLTEAIRSLYSRPALSQSEIANMMTSLAQKFENSQDSNSQKFVSIVVNETRKVLEEKHHEMHEKLYSFENIIKQVSQQASNPKMSMEVTKILTEITSMYSKLSNQEIALQKINQSLATSKTSNALSEILKLSNDFATFSRGFENITHTLNKNFSDFLSQIKEYNSKEELARVQIELDTISGNINLIISALAIIEHKYQDLTGLLDVVNEKESAFNESLNEVKHILGKFDVLQQTVSQVGSKEDFKVISEKITHMTNSVCSQYNELDNDVNTKLRNITIALNDSQKRIDTTLSDKISILNNILDDSQRKIDNTVTDKLNYISNSVENSQKLYSDILKTSAQSANDYETIKLALEGINGKVALSTDLARLHETFEAKSEINFTTLKERLDILCALVEKNNTEEILKEINETEIALSNVTKTSLENIVELICAEFANVLNAIKTRDSENQEGYEIAIKTLRSDIQTFVTNFSSLKDEIAQINQGNIKILQEPIERALQDLRENTFGEQLNAINDNVQQTTSNIANSFENIKQSFEEVASSTNVQVLSQLRDMIPEISDKLEIFRNHVVSENSANLTELKSCFYEISETIKAYLEDTTYKVQDEIKKTYDDSIASIKIDMQDLSNHLIESVENVNSNIAKEFEQYQADVNALIGKLEITTNAIEQKFSEVRDDFETTSNDLMTKISDTLQVNNALLEDKVNEFKTDVIDGILGVAKSSKTNFGIIEEKINKIIASQEQNEAKDDNSALLEAISNVDDKVDRTNLQQIHNAKELMEEIQSISSEVLRKIENSTTIAQKLNSIEGKVEKLNELSEIEQPDIKAEIAFAITNINSNVQEYFEQISELVQQVSIDNAEKFNDIPDFETYLTRIDEYLTHVEYLRNNLSQDIKDSIELQISNFEEKVEDTIRQKDDNQAINAHDIIQRISQVENTIQQLTDGLGQVFVPNADNYIYSLQDVESDLAKLRLSVEKGNKGDNYKEFVSRLIELKNINIENNKLNHLLENQMNQINNWLRNSAQKLDLMAQQIKNNEQMGMEEIKTRLIQSEKSQVSAKTEELNKQQMSYLRDMNDKLETIMQQQSADFDPAGFIDVTYENMKQTKELGARMSAIETKVDKIQGYLEKIVSYIQEEE